MLLFPVYDPLVAHIFIGQNTIVLIYTVNVNKSMIILIDQILLDVMAQKVASNVKIWENTGFCNYLINTICNSFPFHIAFMKLV